jgi:glycosyltransferase involved in cell wall biosynthesis
VKADIRAVYCHNPAPFYKLSSKDMRLDFKFALFNLLYKYLYLINIKKNNFVIVQQDCLRNKFRRFIGKGKIVVAHLSVNHKKKGNAVLNRNNTFFYPAFPRVFKNFEVICKASEMLLKQGTRDFQVMLTISGNENRYSRYIYNSFKHIKNINFLGIQSREKVFELYNSASCVIFPSKLETWGIPITEAKLFMKPLLLADLEYARETLGAYDLVQFFDPDDYEQLAGAMKSVMTGEVVFEKARERNIPPAFSQSWKGLFDILLCGGFYSAKNKLN